MSGCGFRVQCLVPERISHVSADKMGRSGQVYQTNPDLTATTSKESMRL